MIGLAGVYGIFGVLVVTLGSQWGVHHLPAGKASIIIVMELVVAVLSAMVLLGERLDTLEALGLLMVISAAILEGFHVED